MDDVVKQQLICMANNHITGNGSDPAHDFGHALRVMQNAEKIGLEENGDLEILIPAALFHDAVTWPKNDQRSTRAQDESAKLAKVLLCCTSGYPQDKITEVVNVIEICSFSKNIHPVTKEGMILQDADGLEATGAIAS